MKVLSLEYLYCTTYAYMILYNNNNCIQLYGTAQRQLKTRVTRTRAVVTFYTQLHLRVESIGPVTGFVHGHHLCAG